MEQRKKTEPVIATFIGALVLLANSWHVITQWLENPPDRYFTAISHYYADYFLYISQIAQGIRGNWLSYASVYTDERLPSMIIYWPNVLLGRIGSIVTNSPFVLYQAALFAGSVILLFLLWHISSLVFPKRRAVRLIAFLFLTTASNFPTLGAYLRNGTLTIFGDTWFFPTPALNRFGGVPHQIFQTILLLSVIVLYLRRRTLFRTVLFPILCFLAATLAPTQMVLVCFALVVTALSVRKKHVFLITAIGCAAAAFGALLVNSTFASSPILTDARLWELRQIPPISLSVLFPAMGPIIFFIPFGVFSYIPSQSLPKRLLLLYGVGAIAVYFSPIPQLLQTASVRWISPASYTVFPLLAAEGIWAIRMFFKKFRFTLLILLMLYALFTVPSFIAQVNARTDPAGAWYLYGNLNHVPQSAIQAFRMINRGKESGVVLTDSSLPYDILIPVFTDKISFTGHILYTLGDAGKEQLRTRFFFGAMSENEAKQFLSAHRIRYILAPANSSIASFYPFLRLLYTNNSLSVYAN